MKNIRNRGKKVSSALKYQQLPRVLDVPGCSWEGEMGSREEVNGRQCRWKPRLL